MQKVGSFRNKILPKHVSGSLQQDRLVSIKKKNKKLEVIISKARNKEQIQAMMQHQLIIYQTLN